MLSDLFKPFIEGSPLLVMMRGLVERLLNPEQMDQWFEGVSPSWGRGSLPGRNYQSVG